MDLEERAIQLIDRIYEAATEPDRWQDFVEALSADLDGSYVAFGLFAPEDPFAGRAFLVGITPEYRKAFPQQLIQGLPFAAHFGSDSAKQFFELGDLFPDVELTETDFYRNWMAPQRLAPHWPVGCGIYLDGKRPAGWCYLCRPEGLGPLGPQDFALLELLRPHLERALRIHLTLASSRSERRALGEVIDRLPTGVLLIDAQRRVLSTNASADAILAQDDGFKVCGEGGPACADSRRDNEAFKRALAGVLDAEPGEGVRASAFTTISRESGARSYVVMITPLLDASPGSSSDDAVAAIFIADPEAGRVSATQMLERIYQLTHAEAELVRLLSEGCSLEEAAAKRGVTINTARGQLKQVFAKTDTKRQPELVRLVLTGVGTLRPTPGAGDC